MNYSVKKQFNRYKDKKKNKDSLNPKDFDRKYPITLRGDSKIQLPKENEPDYRKVTTLAVATILSEDQKKAIAEGKDPKLIKGIFYAFPGLENQMYVAQQGYVMPWDVQKVEPKINDFERKLEPEQIDRFRTACNKHNTKADRYKKDMGSLTQVDLAVNAKHTKEKMLERKDKDGKQQKMQGCLVKKGLAYTGCDINDLRFNKAIECRKHFMKSTTIGTVDRRLREGFNDNEILKQLTEVENIRTDEPRVETPLSKVPTLKVSTNDFNIDDLDILIGKCYAENKNIRLGLDYFKLYIYCILDIFCQFRLSQFKESEDKFKRFVLYHITLPKEIKNFILNNYLNKECSGGFQLIFSPAKFGKMGKKYENEYIDLFNDFNLKDITSMEFRKEFKVWTNWNQKNEFLKLERKYRTNTILDILKKCKLFNFIYDDLILPHGLLWFMLAFNKICPFEDKFILNDESNIIKIGAEDKVNKLIILNGTNGFTLAAEMAYPMETAAHVWFTELYSKMEFDDWCVSGFDPGPVCGCTETPNLVGIAY